MMPETYSAPMLVESGGKLVVNPEVPVDPEPHHREQQGGTDPSTGV